MPQPALREAPAKGASPSPTVETRSLNKIFPVSGTIVTALRDVNVSVYPRQFVSFVGPSGCGKSTLLNIVAGLLPASSGEAWLDGEPIH
jgi:NitT/TauT family transport system ATP-binding protein